MGIRTGSELIRDTLERGETLTAHLVTLLRKRGDEDALRANAENVANKARSGDILTSIDIEELGKYHPLLLEEFKEKNGTFKNKQKGGRISIAEAARRVGITRTVMWNLLHGKGQGIPHADAHGKYDADEVTNWYINRRVARETPEELKEQALYEDVRLKRAKANIAEGKALPIERAQMLFLELYNLTWQCLKRNAERYGENEEDAINNARVDFADLRKRIEKLSEVVE